MPISDYKCSNCQKIFEYYKASFIEDFPKIVECPECKCSASRLYTGNLVFDIAEGLCGNARSGYSKGITYHPGSLVGKMRGKRIK